VDDLLDAAAEIAPDQAPSGAEVVATASRERELAQARRRVVMRALAEDLGDHGDVTTAATVPATLEGSAEVIARADGVVAGLDCLDEAFAQVDGRVIIERRVRDGDRVTRGDVVATVRGRLRSLLTGERTALNLLCHLSGIATATRRFVDAVDGTGVVIRDTRKTTPGLRLLEKDAVVAGGGTNHRIGLYDQLLVKDNHVIAAGGAGAAAQAAMERADGRPVQVEISRGDQLEEVLAAGVTDILLDNFTPGEVRELVTRTAFRASLEVSGNVTLDTVRAYADTGVDTIAVGAITHSAPWLDLAMDVRQAPAGEG
jgi:nicotinate-nucleotide pyrophosphorylase (carboxylating)